MRVAGGNEQTARRVLLDDVKFHLSDEEEAQMKWAQHFRPCPFTSVYMCVACAASDRSPAQSLSRQYSKLARELDSELFATLEEAARFEASMIGADATVQVTEKLSSQHRMRLGHLANKRP